MALLQLDTKNNQETPLELLKHCWHLFYRHGPTPFAFKSFYHNGSEKEARERAQTHCQVMGYKLIMIKPMLADIQMEENIQLGIKQGGE